MKKSRKEKLLLFFLFLFLTTVFFRNYIFKGLVPFPSNLLVSFYSPWKHEEWEGYPNGPPNKPIGFDVLKLFYPFRKFTIEELKKGEMPLWNPYSFSGNVHLATYQSAVFYPLNFIYFIFPLIDAWSILVILQPILASFLTYLFLRELNLSRKSSFFGSVVFAFSAWMIGWSEESLVIEHTALWLPLMLYATEKIFKKQWSFSLLLFFSFLSSILAGFLQMTIYSLATVFFWVVFRYFQQNKKEVKALTFFIFSLVFAILASSAHLFPSFTAYFNSPRGVVGAKYLFETYLMKPWHAITFLAPDFFGNPGTYNYFGEGFFHEKLIFIGVPAFLLSLYAILTKNKKEEIVFFKYFAIISLLLGFFPLGWVFHFSRLPVISVMIPSRIFFLSTFGFSVLSSYGVEKVLFESENRKSWNKILMTIFFVFLLLWGFVVFHKITDLVGSFATTSFRNLILPTAIFIGCFFTIKAKKKFSQFVNWNNFFYFAFLAINIFSSLYFANKFLYFSERKFVFPQNAAISELQKSSGLNRVWGYGNAYIEKNMTMYYGLYSPEGYDALYSQRYGELLFTQEKEGMITDQILRTDANIKQASEREGILDNWYRRRLLSLTGVKYILEAKVGDGKDFLPTEKRFPPESFDLFWQDDKFRIWNYKESLPRAFLVYDFIVENNRQKIADLLFNKDFDLRLKVVLEKNPPILVADKVEASKVDSLEIKEYEPTNIKIAVETDSNGLLFLSDNYDSDWQAYINGNKTEILRANYAFRAVPIPKGDHQITFAYKPQSFYLGLWITMISLVLLMPVFLVLKKRV